MRFGHLLLVAVVVVDVDASILQLHTLFYSYLICKVEAGFTARKRVGDLHGFVGGNLYDDLVGEQATGFDDGLQQLQVKDL